MATELDDALSALAAAGEALIVSTTGYVNATLRAATVAGRNPAPPPPAPTYVKPDTPANLAPVPLVSGAYFWAAYCDEATSNDDYPVLGYRFYENGVLVGQLPEPQFIKLGRQPSTPYSIRVSSYTIGAESELSDQITITTDASGGVTPPQDTTAPTAPVLDSVVADDSTTITAEFTGSTDTQSGVAWYELQIDDKSVSAVLHPGTEMSYGAMTQGRTYSVRIVAVDYAGNRSTPSNEVQITMPGIIVVPPPPRTIGGQMVTAAPVVVGQIINTPTPTPPARTLAMDADTGAVVFSGHISIITPPPVGFPDLATREADLAARKVGSLSSEDFSGYGNTDAMLAAGANFTGYIPKVNTDGNLEYEQSLDVATFLTHGKALRHTVYQYADYQMGGWGRPLGFPAYDYRPYYVQLVFRFDRNAHSWATPIGGSGGLGNKFIYLKENEGPGQVYSSLGNTQHGIITLNQANGDTVWAKRTLAGDKYLLHNCIDAGGATPANTQQVIRRYGAERRNIGWGITGGNAGSLGSAVPLICDRPGYPSADILAAGDYLVSPDVWAVVTFRIDPAPTDVFPTSGGAPTALPGTSASVVAGQAGRRARVTMWASDYWSPAKLLSDSADPLTEISFGPYRPPLFVTPESAGHRYKNWALHIYRTHGVRELGRPPLVHWLDHAIVSYSPINHPGGHALPASPFGAFTAYSSILA